jgi:ribosomal protein S27E
MALDIACPACGRTLRVAAEHAGKQIRCPACQQVSVAPGGEKSSPASADVQGTTQESSATVWHVRTPEGAVYGPITWNEVLTWVAEGRIAADCELAESGEGPWQSAGNRIRSLQPSAETPTTNAPAPASYPWTSAYAEQAGVSGTSSRANSPATVENFVAPHRAALILVMGLLGFVVGCPIFSMIAWVLGSRDLRAMRSGRMDRSGEGATLAGMILGIIVSVFWLLTAFILLAIALVAIAVQF